MTGLNTEGNPPVGGELEANQTSLPVGTAVPSPVSAEANEVVLKRIETLEKQLRSVQSEKDKGVVKVAKRVDGLEEQLKRYEALRAKGLDPDEAVERIELDEIRAQFRASRGETVVPPVDLTGTQAQAAKVDAQVVSQTLVALGLDPNDSEVKEIILRGSHDPREDFIALAIRRKQPQAQPTSPGAYMPTGSSSPQPSATVEQYVKEMNAARGQGMEVARQIKDRFTKLGINVDEISLA